MRTATCVLACVSAIALGACRDRGAGVQSGGGTVDVGPSASAGTAADASAANGAGDAPGVEPAVSVAAAAVPLTTSSGGYAAPLPSAGAEPKPVFRKAKVDAAQLARIFAAIPELSRVARDVQLFDPNDGSYLLRSDAPHPGIVFSTQPLLYTPEPGMEMLVATGRSRSTSFVVALWVLPNDEYRLASSFLMLHDTAPVALAYSEKGSRLWWTSCWNCPGEQGHLRLTDDRRVVIVQQ